MTFTSWILFISVGMIAIISPGPAILLSISNSIRYGINKVFISSLGNISGLFVLSSAALFGVGAIIKTSTTLFFVIKLFGACYLIYLGIRQWRSKGNFFDQAQSLRKPNPDKSNFAFFAEGLLIALTNPKAILFFTALFPQFVNTQAALMPQFIIMTFTFMAMSFIALVSYGFLAYSAKHWFSTPRRIIGFNRVIGGFFVIIGAGLLRLKIES